MERGDKTMWRRYKKYSPEFRKKVMNELLNGSETYSELTRRYGLSWALLATWMRRYGQVATDEEEDSRMLKARIADLEQMVGRLTMENAFLKKFAACAPSKTSATSSIVTAKTLRTSRRHAGSWALPAARTITEGNPSGSKTPGSKNG